VPASEAQTVVDELTAASHGAAGGLGAMSAAAAQLAPDAKALGLGFTDVVSVLGLLNTKGVDTEKSVRGLRAVFQELQDPSSKLRGELLALGDGTGDFDKALSTLTAGTPRANQALLTLNGPARALVETLGQAGPDALAKFNAGLQQTQGVADRAARVIDDNLKGASQRFGLAIEQIGEKLAKPVLEPFKNELEKLAGELNKFAESPDFQDIEKQAGQMAKSVAEALDKLVHGIDWKTFLADGKDALGQIGDKLNSLAESAGTIATAINKTFDTVGGAAHAVVGGVQLVAGAVSGAAADISEFSDNVTASARGVKDATDKTTGLTQALRAFSDEADAQARPNVEKLHDDIVDLVGANEKAATATKAHGDAAAQAAPKIAEAAQASKETVQAAHEAVTVLPTMTVRLGQTGQAAQTFADDLREASKQAADLKDKSGAAVSGLDAVTAAMGKLGGTSQQALQQAAADAARFFATVDQNSANSAAGLADRQNAFLAYAKTALAASAQLDEGTRASIQYQLESKAAVLGVVGALADLEKQAGASAAALTSDAARSAAAIDQIATSSTTASQSVQDIGTTAKETGDNVKDMAGGGGESLAKLDEALQSTRQGFLDISPAAAKAFDSRLVGDFKNALDSAGNGALGFSRAIIALNQAAADTTKEIANQREELANEIDAINAVGTAGARGFGALGGSVAVAEARVNDLDAAIKSGNYDAGLLGDQDLAQLQQALDAAKHRMDALKASAEAADQQITDLNSQLQDEIDQRNNDQAAIENRKYEKQRQQILDLEKTADAAGKAEAEQALQRLDELHRAKLKEIADAAAAQKQADRGGSSGSSSGSSTAGGSTSSGGSQTNGAGSSANSGGAGGPITAGQLAQALVSAGLQAVHIHADGQTSTVLGDRNALDVMLQQLRFAKARS
jgi:ABC-type transporter Mla subunit MlaD